MPKTAKQAPATLQDFPVGGSRAAVHDALSRRGFEMSSWSDKWWTRYDGLEACVYGSGSKLLVRRDGATIIDDTMAESLKWLDNQ